MKKILLAIVSVILMLTILTFIFIPAKLTVAILRPVNTTYTGFDTCLHNLKKWEQWWPDESGKNSHDSLFVYKGISYKLSAPLSDGAFVQIRLGAKTFKSQIKTVTTVRDSVMAEWRLVLQSGNNPLTRLSHYFFAKKIKKSMTVVFDSLCQFAGKTENIYTYPIKRTTFTEVNLIAYRFKSNGYPTTENIYDAINKLRQYLKSHGATEKYYPMMNNQKTDSSHFENMIAISIDKLIPENGEFFISKMVPMEDRFLRTELTGGPFSIDKAHKAIEKYMLDHALPAPAIPFEILVTERNKVTDTVSWKTIIFYPTM